jgi:hypothetical protein
LFVVGVGIGGDAPRARAPLAASRRALSHSAPQPSSTKNPKKQEVAGTVFTFDEATDCLVLKESGTHGGVHNVRILRASAVKSVSEAVKPPSEDARGPVAALARSVMGPLPHVDLQRAKEREARALKQAQADLAKVGVGVTREAQALFDALAKTMPCEWRQQGGEAKHGEIAVLECVVVRPPYTPADCAALPGAEAEAAAASGALARVRKVLKAARERLGLDSGDGGGGGSSTGGGGGA